MLGPQTLPGDLNKLVDEQQDDLFEAPIELPESETNPIETPPAEDLREGMTVLDALLQAKAESDRGNYAAKHRILQKIIQDNITEFVIDSETPYTYGITHVPTGFRIHMPKHKAPQGIPRLDEQSAKAAFAISQGVKNQNNGIKVGTYIHNLSTPYLLA